ncbi:caspase family protein [Dongia sedimenti]|uniref:Caspase family protein n=1 Tax=Dongia sedimenti TaxID=3064282 RepID=A0ABU0YR17_9PROT|nr:caspase family protein [Rhodospirillaceae bacterium R-7]
MFGKIIAGAAGLCLLAMTFSSAQAEPRVALVIGNSNYGSEIGKLPNPVNDAGLMEQALRQTGFQVVKVTDADWKKMKRAIQDFGDKLAAAGPEATGLFFYAGHGVQVQGQNYLVPVGADISKEADVNIESVSADTILQQMEYAGTRVSIVVLDACRNNPLQRSFRSASRGLAPMQAAQGSFIAYSTSPGSVAADGQGKNSPYTAALAKTIVQPGVGIEEAFRDVRTQVMAATKDNQVPWDSSSLTAPFFFKPAAAQFTTATAAPAPKPAAAATPASLEVEKAVWDGIKDSKEAGDFQAYLTQYPNGVFAGVAKSRLASLGAGVPREQPAVPQEQPAAAPVAAEVSPEPVAVSVPAAEAPAGDGILRDSNGVDCRIMDATRSQADCKGISRSGGGGGGYSGGGSSKTSGSHGWN